LRKLASAAYEELLEPERCPECRSKLVDAGGEVACPFCGVVLGPSRPSQDANTAGSRPEMLGSFIGPASNNGGRAQVAGCAIGVTKRWAEAIGRNQSFLRCSGLIETVACRFFLPKTVVQNAVQTARRLLPSRGECRATVPAISAYSLLYACRSAGICHVGFRDVLKAYSEAGHKVSKSQLLRIGRGSSLPLPAAKPEEMTKRAVATLQSNPAVLDRIRKANLDQSGYFATLLEGARATAAASTDLGGFSPRTLAAASVYLAGRRLGPRTITQKEAAESLGIAEYTVREFCNRFRSQEAM